SAASALADNAIGNVVEAYVKSADTKVKARAGQIDSAATADATIHSTTVAAARAASAWVITGGVAVRGAGAARTNASTNMVPALGTSLSGAGAKSMLTISGTTEAYANAAALTATGHTVTVTAATTSTANPTVGGGSFGLLGSVAIMLSEVDLGGTTRAYAAG